MSGRVRARVGFVAGAALALAAAGACFSEKRESTGPDGSTPCVVPLSLIEAGHTIVAMRDYAFRPDTVRVPVGTTVSWVNCAPRSEDPHTTTSDTGLWDSNLMSSGQFFSVEFTEAGVYPFHCIPHQFTIGMDGAVVVE